MSAKVSIIKAIDSSLGPLFCRMLSRAQKIPETRRISAFSAPKILVIRPGGIGDAIMLLPALKALSELLSHTPAAAGSSTAPRNGSIDVLCESRNAQVFEISGLADNILTYDRTPFRTLNHLRGRHYDIVLDTEQFHNFSAVFCALTRAPVRVGFNINPARLDIYSHLVPYDLLAQEDTQFMSLVNAVSDRRVTAPSRENILNFDENAAKKTISSLPERFYAVHAGGSVACKRWNSGNYASLCKRVFEKTGLKCVLVGDKSDCAYARAIAAKTPECTIDLCGKLNISQTASVCKKAERLVGPDSGIAHLAVAVGTKTVVLFGPSDPRKWGPPPESGSVVKCDMQCSPCSIFGYVKHCNSYTCINSITVDSVLEKILK